MIEDHLKGLTLGL